MLIGVEVEYLDVAKSVKCRIVRGTVLNDGVKKRGRAFMKLRCNDVIDASS